MKDEQKSNKADNNKESDNKEGTLSKEDYWDYIDKSEDNLKKD